MPSVEEDRLVRIAYGAYTKGEAINAIAERQNVTPQWLYYRFRRRGWRLRAAGSAIRKITPRLTANVIAMSSRNLPVKEIARRLEVSRWTVEKVRRAEGVRGVYAGATAAPGRKRHRFDAERRLTHKWCPACKRMRQARFFWKNKLTADGKQTQCADCARGHRKSLRAARASNTPQRSS